MQSLLVCSAQAEYCIDSGHVDAIRESRDMVYDSIGSSLSALIVNLSQLVSDFVICCQLLPPLAPAARVTRTMTAILTGSPYLPAALAQEVKTTLTDDEDHKQLVASLTRLQGRGWCLEYEDSCWRPLPGRPDVDCHTRSV
jgi:hypothetical protein